MGQRHQLFVIAKVFNRFRTLAAVHHQQLSSQRALQRCLRSVEILQATPNRIPVSQELRAARRKDDDFWATSKEFQPFPFIATCLTVGCSFDPGEGYQDRVHPLPFNVTLDRINNNDGISVMDITNPGLPRYCFSFLPGGVQPLDARTYLWRYMRNRDIGYASLEDSDDTWIQSIMDALKGEDAEAKLQVEEDRVKHSEEVGRQISRNRLVQRLHTYPLISPSTLHSWSTQSLADDPLGGEDLDQVKALSLRDQAMDQLIDSTLKDPDSDPHSAAQAQQLLDFVPRYRSKLLSLAERAELPQPSSLVGCIKLAFSGETVIDLSPFSDVPAEQLVQAALEILKSETVEVLNLSHLRQLSEAHLTSILGSAPRLQTLHVIEMPQISVQYVARVWARPNSRIRDIYHTEMLRRPFVKKNTYSNLLETIKSPLVEDAKNPIKNIMWARVLIGEPYGDTIRKSDSVKVDWQRLKPAVSDLDDDPTMRCAVYPLQDLLLTPTKLVTALGHYFTYLEKDQWGYCTSGGLAATGFALAKSLALASSQLSADVTRIGPLPESMFKASSISAKISSLHWPLDFPEMKEGEGSIVIINKHDEFGRWENKNEERFRLAVVFSETSGANRAYKVESMESFLESMAAKSAWAKTEETAPLLDYWKRKTGFVELAESEEIHELLTAMERNIKHNRESSAVAWTRIRSAWS